MPAAIQRASQRRTEGKPEREPPQVFVNARVVTCDEWAPLAESILVDGTRFVAVGSARSVLASAPPSCRVVDVGRHTVVPGIVDAHCHLFGSAAARLALDCSSRVARRIPEVLAVIAAAADAWPAGEWIYGRGFDESLVREQRFPTREELDAAAPRNPVEIEHGSGHASALNSRACALLGVPPGERADGLFYEPRFARRRQRRAVERELTRLSREWAAKGTTSVQDAGADNGPDDYEALCGLAGAGAILQRVGVFTAPRFAAPMRLHGPARADVRINGVKLELREAALSTATMSTVEDAIREHAAAGRLLVAIHVVELGALAALLDLLERVRADGIPLVNVRLEHVSLCPPEWARRIADLGVTVVTQPGFLLERGERYRRLIPPQQYGWLYPVGELLRAGVAVAGSSDSPVGGANPFAAMAAAIRRRSSEGAHFPGPRLSRRACLALYTSAAARAVGRGHELGRIAPGYLADFTILDRDPLSVPLGDLPHTRALATYVGGRLVHGSDAS